MLQMLPMIAGLLQDKQKQNEQKKQDEMSAYMGQAPGAHAQGGGMLSGLTGMLQGLGDKKKPQQFQDPGVPSELGYDAAPPVPEDEIL